ncbi:DNA helicase [Pseudomonas phage MR5]|uniref:DNA helicase n=1 Tax=Pseudomonas phage MR5 TaxID=2711172 RepID=A0A6M3TCP8_9CAUD|nr:DNA helicase [Pseudomonas phage MR5]
MEMLGQEAALIIGWFKLYWENYKGHEFIDIDALDSLIKLRSGYPAETLGLVMRLTAQLRRPVDQATLDGIVGQLMELDLAGRAAALIQRHASGEDINLPYELHKLTSAAKERMTQGSAHEWIDRDVVSILEEEAGDHGIKLPTLLLSQNIKGLLGGASIAVAARPDKGKTSLLASILTYAAPQLPKYFDEDRPILWLNNEGRGCRIIPRVYQAALDCNVDQLYTKSNAGVLVPEYIAKVGRRDRIRIKDMHGATLPELEQVIEAMKPAIVCCDMVANYRLPGGAGGGNKTDEVEEKWIQLREMAVRHDFIHFGTIQVSNEGGDMLYPAYSALKDSKTGVQGATDVILMMGAMDDPKMQSLRGLSTPKNKFALPGKQSHVQGEVYFDAPNCQFRDGAEGYSPNGVPQ